MTLVEGLYFWTNQVWVWGLIALRAWALVDCLTQKTAAFPAVDKLTKPAWTAILALGGLISCWLSLGSLVAGPVYPSIIDLITAVTAAVYLADVRPAVKEISGGR